MIEQRITSLSDGEEPHIQDVGVRVEDMRRAEKGEPDDSSENELQRCAQELCLEGELQDNMI